MPFYETVIWKDETCPKIKPIPRGTNQFQMDEITGEGEESAEKNKNDETKVGENEKTEARTEELASVKRHNLRNRAGLKPPSCLKDFNQSEVEATYKSNE